VPSPPSAIESGADSPAAIEHGPRGTERDLDAPQVRQNWRRLVDEASTDTARVTRRCCWSACVFVPDPKRKCVNVKRLSSAAQLAVASIIAGLSGLVVTWAVARVTGPEAYAIFAVFWSALYLVIGCLAGVQQEVTRSVAVSGRSNKSSSTSGWRFAVGVAAGTVIAVAASLPLWAPSSFGAQYGSLAVPLLLGVGVFVFMATVSGSLAGGDSWTGVAFIIAMDGILRLAAIGLALLWTDDPAWLAWMVIAPLPLTLTVAVVAFRRVLRGTMVLADRYRTLLWNVVRTMTASAGSAILITGFPLVLAIVADGQEHKELAPLILAITLTRAPLLMPLSAFQGFLVVQFAKRITGQWRLVLTLTAALVAIGSVAALLASLLGPAILETFFGSGYALDGGLLALLVAAAAAIACLYITGPAVLARGGHAGYALGWIGAVIFALFAISAPGDLSARTVCALIVGPLIGVVIHIAFLLVGRRPRPLSSSEVESVSVSDS
jgi:O-antigen/teichoic acid export membrane protein